MSHTHWPVVYETQSGMARWAEQMAWAIASAVATREGRPTETVRGELIGRVAILRARNTALAILKRGRVAPAIPTALRAAVQRALVEGAGDGVAGATAAAAAAG